MSCLASRTLYVAGGVLFTLASWATIHGQDRAPIVHGHVLEHRWVYLPNNFQVAENVDRVIGILDRARMAGYNGALLADVKFGRLDDGSLLPAYYTNLQRVLEHARALGMETIPATADFGYSASILWHDPNLAEALPVRNATYRVRGGILVPYEERPVRLANGDFETLPESGDRFPGWAWQDQPSITTFVDREVRHSGQASLRMTDIGVTNPPHGHGRIYQRVAVEPFWNYHVSVWIKTEDFHGGTVQVLVLGENPSRTLQYNPVPIEPNQDWTRFDVTFNSLTHSEVLFYFGVWNGGRGTIWWDDGHIEPAGFVNTVRRPGAPVRITDLDGQTEYVEGRDVAPIVDPLVGQWRWRGNYDLWHEPPRITIPPGSRLTEGQVVRIDHYHTATIRGFQVTASLTEPAVFAICRQQLASLRREFAGAGMFQGWMFGHDEIRMHGWDEAPRAGDGTPGSNLAYNFQTLYAMAREIDPQARILVWSDMFDPYHNAAKRDTPYYLVNGDWSGSWLGLPQDVVIVNWHHHAGRREAAEFFASRGHRQILAGYYDAPPEQFGDRQWLADLAGVPGISGVMYTPWSTGYDQLEAWAQHVWGDVGPTPTPVPLARAARYLPLVER